MAINTSRVRWSARRKELAFGYLVQVVSLLLLLTQHFALPVILGLRAYGLLAFTVGCASLLFSAYDCGYNLLTVRKPRLGLIFLSYKYAILSVVATGFVLYTSAAGTIDGKLIVPILAHAFLFVFYTFLINREIASGRIRRVVLFCIVNGSLLILVPIVFAATGINIPYAPFCATALSLVVVLAGRSVPLPVGAGRSVFARPLRIDHLWRTFIKQTQISFGTIVDATIVWLGVVVIATCWNLEAAAIYRIVMSALRLMTCVLPLPKQILLRLARTKASFSWARLYAILLILGGATQVVAVYLFGKQAIAVLFPDSVDAIYSGVLLLSPIAAIQAIFELETILYDCANRLPMLLWNSLLAAVPATSALVYLGVYWAILLFYLTLGAVSASAFFMRPSYVSADC